MAPPAEPRSRRPSKFDPLQDRLARLVIANIRVIDGRKASAPPLTFGFGVEHEFALTKNGVPSAGSQAPVVGRKRPAAEKTREVCSSREKAETTSVLVRGKTPGGDGTGWSRSRAEPAGISASGRST